MEWISVKDELPQKGIRVLITDREIVCEANRNNITGLWQGWQLLSNEYLDYENISHWMPLPNPPVE